MEEGVNDLCQMKKILNVHELEDELAYLESHRPET